MGPSVLLNVVYVQELPSTFSHWSVRKLHSTNLLLESDLRDQCLPPLMAESLAITPDSLSTLLFSFAQFSKSQFYIS